MGLHPPIGSLTYDPFADKVNVNFPSFFDLRMVPFLASAQHLSTPLTKQTRMPLPAYDAAVSTLCDGPSVGRCPVARFVIRLDASWVIQDFMWSMAPLYLALPET